MTRIKNIIWSQIPETFLRVKAEMDDEDKPLIGENKSERQSDMR